MTRRTTADRGGALFPNGLNGVTGTPLVEPIPLESLRDRLTGLPPSDPTKDAGLRRWLTRLADRFTKQRLGLPEGVSPDRLDQAGWGIVFHSAEDPAVREALEPLVEHRRKQTGEDRFQILEYCDGDEWSRWIGEQGGAPGSQDPTVIPFYLLLVGSPVRIPLRFSHLLSTEYAVGRLHFETAAEYGEYVRGVLRYETEQHDQTERAVVYFGTRHPFDAATELSADHLVAPLADTHPSQYGFAQRLCLGDDATKAALKGILSAHEHPAPAILFTATHGMGWPADHPEQRRLQGALLCQDWPGLGSITPDDYFSAEDLGDDRIHGMISFHFACYSAGTPSTDRFFPDADEIAEEAFFAALPQALLSRPGGGALACIGHVERAWGYSIRPPNAGAHLGPFRNTIDRLMAGRRVGLAVRDFTERYAVMSTELSSLYDDLRFNEPVADSDLAYRWIARNDAEGYIILGDPAVRLRDGAAVG